MTDYIVCADGCDDSTSALVDLTETELAVVQRICDVITSGSDSGCKPRLKVQVADEASQYNYESATKPMGESA